MTDDVVERFVAARAALRPEIDQQLTDSRHASALGVLDASGVRFPCRSAGRTAHLPNHTDRCPMDPAGFTLEDRHGIAADHAICPSKSSIFAMSR
jgi:hypothetical protein